MKIMKDDDPSPSDSKSHEIQQAPAAEFAGVDLPEKRQEDEDTLEWFARSLGKPSPSDLADMLRWTQKTIVADNMVEYQLRWITKSLSVLDKIDKVAGNRNPFQVKRTMLLIVMADYLGKPRKQVFDRDDTAGRIAFGNWMKEPELKTIFDEMYSMMEEETMLHEANEVKRAATITRISAGKAAEVRMQLLEHPNPWVQLQAARDIMQAADRATAAKGGTTNWNISATLSEEQVDQVLARASEELRGWEDIAAPGTEGGRPLVIVEQETSVDEDSVKKLTDGEDSS